MRSKDITYTPLSKLIWLMLALFVVVFCGPVKKIIELRELGTTQQPITEKTDKKLRTAYREKHETNQFFPGYSHCESWQPALAILFVASLFLSLLFNNNNLRFKVSPKGVFAPASVPLYLYIRKLQV